ncbi:uncharacterized protein METZ01_LOCUS436960, partial [marine metagenome]
VEPDESEAILRPGLNQRYNNIAAFHSG